MAVDIQTRYTPPAWAFTLHGHQCPFMPLGWRMGVIALHRLQLERELDHTLHVICELGEGHPQTCLMDGIQAATGATFGKTLMEKTNWGKLAATFWYPGITAVRYALRNSFLNALGEQEFFAWRKRGVEPSSIPEAVTDAAVAWTLAQPDDVVFSVSERPDFSYLPPRGSFNRATCSACGESVFERESDHAAHLPHPRPAAARSGLVPRARDANWGRPSRLVRHEPGAQQRRDGHRPKVALRCPPPRRGGEAPGLVRRHNVHGARMREAPYG